MMVSHERRVCLRLRRETIAYDQPLKTTKTPALTTVVATRCRRIKARVDGWPSVPGRRSFALTIDVMVDRSSGPVSAK